MVKVKKIKRSHFRAFKVLNFKILFNYDEDIRYSKLLSIIRYSFPNPLRCLLSIIGLSVCSLASLVWCEWHDFWRAVKIWKRYFRVHFSSFPNWIECEIRKNYIDENREEIGPSHIWGGGINSGSWAKIFTLVQFSWSLNLFCRILGFL